MMASLLPFIAVPLIVQKDYHVFRQIIADLPALETDWYTAIEQKKIAWLGAAKQWRSMQIEPESFKRWFAGHGQELISSDLWRYAECLLS